MLPQDECVPGAWSYSSAIMKSRDVKALKALEINGSVMQRHPAACVVFCLVFSFAAAPHGEKYTLHVPP